MSIRTNDRNKGDLTGPLFRVRSTRDPTKTRTTTCPSMVGNDAFKGINSQMDRGSSDNG